MKTHNRPNKIKLNKYFFHSSKPLNKYKNKNSDVKKEQLFDEIELKTQFIKENNKKIKKIKIESIKELVYANKNIPEKWKSKREYPTQVLELFSKDSKFLNYVGNKGGSTNNENITKSTQNLRNINNLTNISNKNFNIKNKKINLSIITENNKINNLTKYCHTTPTKNRYNSLKEKFLNEKEILNILDELQMNYPIKEKLAEIYPEEEIRKIGLKNEILKNKNNKNINIRYPLINSEKKKEEIKNNIYVNLFTSYNKQNNKENKNENINSKYIDDYDINLLKIRKEMIKNPIANKHLERINFYGPYYSYCPSCGYRNLKFYKKLNLNQLIKFTNIIKKYRKKNNI